MTERDALDVWAGALQERGAITDFLEWCSAQRIELCQWTDNSRWPTPTLSGYEKLLDDYHGIDRTRLEEQRRALLEEVRAR